MQLLLKKLFVITLTMLVVLTICTIPTINNPNVLRTSFELEDITSFKTNSIYLLNENNLLVIECEGSLYKLATMNPEEFPELPKINIENSITLDQRLLKSMIRKTIFAVSIEENRPILIASIFSLVNRTASFLFNSFSNCHCMRYIS